MNPLRQIVKSLLTTCIPREKFLVSGPRSFADRPTIALTFDDGPHPDYTPRLLDQLNELGLIGTFFVIGNNAKRYPDLIRKMATAGHEIANHTYSHSEPRETSTAKFVDEIQQTDDLLESLTGRITETVRPPKGELNWTKLCGIWRRRKTVALWNVDPKDFRMVNSEEMTRWCESYVPRDGDIVLLHDNHKYASRAVEALASRGVFDRFETTTIRNWVRGIDCSTPLISGA
jgi:peptidoglycan/xylan/chitin deacetylase (PgdA/CDA1 family)